VFLAWGQQKYISALSIIVEKKVMSNKQACFLKKWPCAIILDFP
jgi:hypothetical protein